MGRALINALAEAAGGTVGVRRSYTAKGWHAQISKLTSSPRGYLAAERAGLSVNRRTLLDWLAERREPSKANQERIAKAYGIMAGRWPDDVEGREFSIRGEVKTGDDERTRTLTIDSSAPGVDWRRMRDAWEDGEPDPDDFEDWFIEDVIEMDIGEGSDGWEFPGGSYTVVIG
jgi:transcriptional regulator with XRE-family HTH domain